MLVGGLSGGSTHWVVLADYFHFVSYRRFLTTVSGEAHTVLWEQMLQEDAWHIMAHTGDTFMHYTAIECGRQPWTVARYRGSVISIDGIRCRNHISYEAM